MVTKRQILMTSNPGFGYGRNKRLKPTVDQLARQIRNLGEIKCKTQQISTQVNNAAVGVLELTTIAQGSNSDSRIGNEIEVVRVEVRGQISIATFPFFSSFHLVSSFSETLPDTTFFNATATGAFVDHVKGTEFRCQQMAPNGSQSFVRMNWKPTYRWIVRYSGAGTGDCIRNRLFFIINNMTGGQNLTPQIACRIYYRDV